jgi:hypothetical protein
MMTMLRCLSVLGDKAFYMPLINNLHTPEMFSLYIQCLEFSVHNMDLVLVLKRAGG